MAVTHADHGFKLHEGLLFSKVTQDGNQTLIYSYKVKGCRVACMYEGDYLDLYETVLAAIITR